VCGDSSSGPYESGPHEGIPRLIAMEDLLAIARQIVPLPEVRRTAVGFIGYGATKPGDRVLIGVDTRTDPEIVHAISAALRENGAHVDVVTVEHPEVPDKKFTETEEIDFLMRREPWENRPRSADRTPWIEELARSRRYDLLIHGPAGPVPKSDHRYEGFPWFTQEHFRSPCNIYPRDLHTLINQRTWDRITQNTGGRMLVTDPEGTNLSLTIRPGPMDAGDRHDYGLRPKWGHLMAHPPTPIEKEDDTTGVIAGTTSHYSSPFPRIEVDLRNAKVEEIRGGGGYGEAWRGLVQETDGTQYPSFPGPGLFWLWEIAIGTNPWVVRPRDVEYHASCGFEWERRKAGFIHCGFGTRWNSKEEFWAAERGLLYGHLHVHLMLPTLLIEATDGRTIPVIERGRLSAYDDPDVRDCAANYGDPDEFLSDMWTPPIPGISAEGSYEEYAKNPAGWTYSEGLRTAGAR
jgi:hypothetical protein